MQLDWLRRSGRLCAALVALQVGAALLASARCVHAQGDVEEPAQARLLQVYLDCNDCDDDHIRSELRFVEYVRDPQQAQVHVFVTTARTVLSGEQFEFSFIGLDAYQDTQISFARTVDQATTMDETRELVNAALQTGLAPFVAQLDPKAVSVSYDESLRREDAVLVERDPWRYWTFTLYGGDFELDLESNREVFDSRWGFFADHRSEDWKVRVRPYFNYDLFIVRREGREDVRSSISRHGLDTYVIRSLGPHWSAAIFGTYISRNDRNLRHRGSLLPGVEYSFLPYSEATRRTITLSYVVGVSFADYYDTTIYDVDQEWLPQHTVDFSVVLRRPWGDIFGGVELLQYLHDTSLLRAEFGGYISVRLFEGFSVQFQGEYEMIRDQLSLPKGDALLSEILLQQRELATDYSFSASVAFTYTFGSRFANIVNTRF